MPSASYLLTDSSQPAHFFNLRRWLANSPPHSRLQTWFPVALFLGMFAMESTRAFGSDHTSAPLQHIFQAIFGSEVNDNWSHLHHLIRKTGHFTAYGTFSLFAYQAAARTLKRHIPDSLQHQQFSHILAVTATLIAASADEIHQCFLPNRTGCLADVLLDTAGAVTLQLALIVALHCTTCRSRARAGSQDARALQPQPAVAM